MSHLKAKILLKIHKMVIYNCIIAINLAISLTQLEYKPGLITKQDTQTQSRFPCYLQYTTLEHLEKPRILYSFLIINTAINIWETTTCTFKITIIYGYNAIVYNAFVCFNSILAWRWPIVVETCCINKH